MTVLYITKAGGGDARIGFNVDSVKADEVEGEKECTHRPKLDSTKHLRLRNQHQPRVSAPRTLGPSFSAPESPSSDLTTWEARAGRESFSCEVRMQPVNNPNISGVKHTLRRHCVNCALFTLRAHGKLYTTSIARDYGVKPSPPYHPKLSKLR